MRNSNNRNNVDNNDNNCGSYNLHDVQSRYSSEVKSEMRRINANSRNPCNFTENLNNLPSKDEIGILRSIERERAAVIPESINADCIETVKITEKRERTDDFRHNRNGGFMRRMLYRRNRRRDCGCGNDAESVIIIEKNGECAGFSEFTDPTNCYRFVCQNFYNNMTGKSNIDVTNTGNNTAEKRILIEHILKKYGVNK